MNETDDRPDAAASSPPSSQEESDFDTRALFAGRSEIRITHQNTVYRLRITRAGKLILNK